LNGIIFPLVFSHRSDSSKKTQLVKGLNGWEGEILGTPVKDSSFTKLQIGMSLKQVTDLIGEPTDQGEAVPIA